jgi:pyridoxamine 5'-phosphate oxidase
MSKTQHTGLSIADMRREYSRAGFSEDAADANPFRQFETWFQEAVDADVVETNAMILATATPDGRPSARVVLLKGMDDEGFVFFTNYESHKGRELDANPQAALLFYWPQLTRQVRIEGTVSRVPQEESSAYFHTRSRLSQLGAWASHQSQMIPSREYIDQRLEDLIAEYEGADVPLPPYWGGYRLHPVLFEFWHGRPNRLHDRLQYTLQPDGSWPIVRLSP